MLYVKGIETKRRHLNGYSFRSCCLKRNLINNLVIALQKNAQESLNLLCQWTNHDVNGESKFFGQCDQKIFNFQVQTIGSIYGQTCCTMLLFLQIGILVNYNIRKGAISLISRHMMCTGINISFIFILTVFSPKRKKIRKLNTTFILITCISAFIGVIANSIPKMWGLLWILSKLIGVNHMYSSPSFYPMQNHSLCYLLINISFFTTTSTMSFQYFH